MSHQPAFRADGQRVSRSAFYAMACDPGRSVVVEACAGAGKTWMLVSRIVRALLDGALPHEILAITFTRKAAAEMRERLDAWLRAFAAPTASAEQRMDELVQRGVPPDVAPAWADALAGLQRRVLDSGRAVEVRTFHAWFAQLLRAAPFELLDELGLDPEAELLQDIEDHRAELMRRFHAALLQDGARRSDYEALIAQRGRSQATKWFEQVLSRRIEMELADRAGTLEGSVAAVVAEGAAAPREIVASPDWMAELGALAEALRRSGARAARQGDLLAQAIGIAEVGELYSAVRDALFTKQDEPRKLGDVAGLADLQRRLQDIAVRQHRHECRLEHLRMVRVARVLLTEYADFKRAHGLLDMNDLELGALHLLRDATLAGWVQERLDMRVRHVLIDEFQDTSPLQWHALHAWLSGYAGAGGGTSGQRPPSVFVVGDPKQSIYRFRRAEPRVFAAMREFVVEALDGSVLECDHTRRNAGPVIEAINAVFEPAQQTGLFEGFRVHTTEAAADPAPGLRTLPRVARPLRKDSPATDVEPRWRDSLTEPRREPEAARREAEAQAVADEIARQLSAGSAPREIMVLARKRAPLRSLAQALLHRHVPFVAVDDATLVEAPEAQDLLAVLDALVSPQHRLSLARALRSPLFGVSDADLLALARRAEASGDWWAALMAWDGASDPLARARRWLALWQHDAKRLPPHDLLDRIVSQGELRERLASCVPAARRTIALAMVDAVLVQALALDGGRYATPYGFVRALRRRTINVPAPDLGGAVRLLTMHGAKGLEADVVFVMDADPERTQTDTATLLVDWPVGNGAPRRCAFVYSEGQVPSDLADLMADEQRARDREELNGLYVAMTRARRALVFSATEPHRPGERESWWQRVVPCAAVPVPPDDAPARPVLEPEPQVLALPRWGGAPAEPVMPPGAGEDTAAARLGRAVHRVLEWYSGTGGDLPALAAGTVAEFGAPADEVARLAGRIVHSAQGAAFFDRAALCWAGNEVPVALDGEVLRIDRLVCLGPPEAPCWWVLDYKLQGQAAADLNVREQLQRYCRAVAPLAAGAPVRAAVITGNGDLQVVI